MTADPPGSSSAHSDSLRAFRWVPRQQSCCHDSFTCKLGEITGPDVVIISTGPRSITTSQCFGQFSTSRNLSFYRGLWASVVPRLPCCCCWQLVNWGKQPTCLILLLFKFPLETLLCLFSTQSCASTSQLFSIEQTHSAVISPCVTWVTN